MDRGYDTRSPIQKKSSLPRTFALFRGYVFFTIVLFFTGFFFVLVYTPLFKIRAVYVSGSTMTPNENIQAYVAKVLEGNWRTLIPFNTVVGVPTKTIEEGILKSFPSVEKVEVNRKKFSYIEVFIVEKKPVFSFCEEQNCVFVDDKGIVFGFSKNDPHIIIEGSPAQFVRRSANIEKDTIMLGRELLPEKNRNELNKAISFLAAKNFLVKKITLQQLGFFDVQVTPNGVQNNLEFRFRDNKKLDQQLQELHLALEKGLHEKIMQNKVEYVISYIPQKVIYKNTTIQD